MRYIDESMTILEICEKYPESIEFLESKGFKNLSNETIKNMLGKLTLKNALLTKKVNVETFMEMLNEYVTQNRESTDITMKKNNIVDEEITVMGLLPCPIRIPLLEGFTKFLEENPEYEIRKINLLKFGENAKKKKKKYLVNDKFLQVYQNDETDGFFICKIGKK